MDENAPRVKVCGITTLADAQLATELGAWALGMIFYEGSPRRCSLAQARSIAATLRRRVELSGVFVNAPLEQIVGVCDELGLSLVQLHGDEGPAFCSEVARRTGARVIKAVQVAGSGDVRDLERYHVDFHLLDARCEGGGATGDARRHGRDVRLGARARAALEGAADPQRRPHAGERRRGDLGGAPVRGRHGERHRGRAGAQGPRAAAGVLRGGGGCERAAGDDRPAGVSADGEASALEHRFGPYGGQFVPETLMPALAELERAWQAARRDPSYRAELDGLLRDFGGRPTPLYRARRLSERVGRSVYLKREDLNHTGSHKLNNALGQVLLAKRMGKRRIIAETGAGQHGVATATVCALLDMECVVYMGVEDTRRQRPNVQRMELLGATVQPVDAGARTLKEATSAAIRDWVTNVQSTHYVIGSVVGPAPYPALVRDLQRVIGDEARAQMLEREGRLPARVVACVGGGSNAMGIFTAFIADEQVELVGVEAGGEGIDTDRHGAPLTVGGRPGILHGSRSAVMQDEEGQISQAHSISAGLDYPGAGPQHAYLRDTARARYVAVTDAQALPRSARSRGWRASSRRSRPRTRWRGCSRRTDGELDLVCLSGRGDKDLAEVLAGGEA